MTESPVTVIIIIDVRGGGGAEMEEGMGSVSRMSPA